MEYFYPFGETVRRLVQQDRTPKQVFVLGVYAIRQFLNRIAQVNYTSLQEYVNLYGYGNPSKALINGDSINVLPIAHPRQIGALGAHSEKWFQAHLEWENKNK